MKGDGDIRVGPRPRKVT